MRHLSRRVALVVLPLVLVWTGSAVAQASASGGSTASDVVLRPGDVLRISVWPNPEASGDFSVEETGFVNLPYLQEVRAGGVPVSQLRAELRRRYAEAMRNPVVTVTPMYRVTVTGEVMRPGVQTITPTYSVFDVIALAGGFRPDSDAEKVRIVRAGEVVEYDALRALETGEGMDAVQLRSGDHIVVPARRRAMISYRNALALLQTVSLIVLTYERFTRTGR
jgi:polysaccharide biosynthesis/export protein